MVKWKLWHKESRHLLAKPFDNDMVLVVVFSWNLLSRLFVVEVTFHVFVDPNTLANTLASLIVILNLRFLDRYKFNYIYLSVVSIVVSCLRCKICGMHLREVELTSIVQWKPCGCSLNQVLRLTNTFKKQRRKDACILYMCILYTYSICICYTNIFLFIFSTRLMWKESVTFDI